MPHADSSPDAFEGLPLFRGHVFYYKNSCKSIIFALQDEHFFKVQTTKANRVIAKFLSMVETAHKPVCSSVLVVNRTPSC